MTETRELTKLDRNDVNNIDVYATKSKQTTAMRKARLVKAV